MQSILCLLLGGFLLISAGWRLTTWRAVSATLGLAAFLVLAYVLPLPTDRFTMGDGTNLAQERSAFMEIVHAEREIRFSAHLAYLLLDRIDAAFGSTPTSPTQSYRALSWLAGAAFALLLAYLAATEHWSPRTVRYMALAVLAPATLMYFGYLEVGYLALSSAAFPLVARDLFKGNDLTASRLVGSLLYGMGAALHGVGYLGIVGLCAAVLASDIRIGRRLVLAAALSAIAVGAALIWLWYYLAMLGLSVIPHHAVGGFILRPLWEAREAESRILYPLLSTIAARDLFLSGLVAGVPLVVVVLLIRKQWSRESKLALAFTVPCLIFFVLFWPVQGIAVEMDMIVAAFPAIYPLLWVCAQSLRASLASAGLLALGHWTFWRVVLDDRFINDMLR